MVPHMHDGAVDLTNCDREPIHLIGSIQSFGLLIAVSADAWVVTRASRSAEQWLGLSPQHLIGRSLASIFTETAVHTIRGQLQGAIMGDMVARLFGIQIVSGGPRCDLAIHMLDRSVIIECEPSVDDGSDNTGLMVRGMIARL